MNTDFWQQVFDFAQATASRVGEQLLQDFGQVLADEKADGSLVTRSDKWADLEIQNAIASTFPGHGILTEEGSHTFPDTEWCWIIDPVDGTTNFARGIPIWGISLGLLYQGTPVFGYVYFPPINQAFHGYWCDDLELSPPPKGAFCNDLPIHSSSEQLTGNHFFSICTRTLQSFPIKGFPGKIRMLGVASYNLLTVANATTLGAVESTPKIWDIAAVWVIAQASGCAWMSLNPQPMFPLTSGKDYGSFSFPTLLVSRPDLLPIFQPYVNLIKL